MNKNTDCCTYFSRFKILNFLAYNYHCLGKLLAIFFIASGAVILSSLFFPLARIFTFGKNRFKKLCFMAVHFSFVFFTCILKVFHISKVKWEDRKTFKNLKSTIVVANHPSILDVVYLISMIPESTVIVSEKYSNSPFGGIIKNCYILNSVDFDELCHRCNSALDEGYNVIIFPEGTRTPVEGPSQYKKGAARIALSSGKNILPVFIGGSSKFGLSKNNPFWSYNHAEQLFYHMIPLEEIKTEEYRDLENQIAAKRITDRIQKTIKEKAEQYKNDHPLSKTVNNV